MLSLVIIIYYWNIANDAFFVIQFIHSKSIYWPLWLRVAVMNRIITIFVLSQIRVSNWHFIIIIIQLSTWLQPLFVPHIHGTRLFVVGGADLVSMHLKWNMKDVSSIKMVGIARGWGCFQEMLWYIGSYMMSYRNKSREE